MEDFNEEDIEKMLKESPTRDWTVEQIQEHNRKVIQYNFEVDRLKIRVQQELNHLAKLFGMKNQGFSSLSIKDEVIHKAKFDMKKLNKFSKQCWLEFKGE